MTAARQGEQHLPSAGDVGRFAVDLTAEAHDRVDPEHQRIAALCRYRRRLAVGILEDDLGGRARLEFLDRGNGDRELDAELFENRPPLGRARSEDQPRSGKNSATSRAADSVASEPWTMFCPTAIA